MASITAFRPHNLPHTEHRSPGFHPDDLFVAIRSTRHLVFFEEVLIIDIRSLMSLPGISCLPEVINLLEEIAIIGNLVDGERPPLGGSTGWTMRHRWADRSG